MKLAKAFAEIDSADREPAATTVKRYMPIGSVSGSGVVSVSAFDAIVQQQQLQFRGVRFEVSSADEYGVDGLVTVAEENAEKLISSLETLANAHITTEKYALTEVETNVDELRVVVFNTEAGSIMAAVEAQGTICHLMMQRELLDLAKLVSLALEHLRKN